MAKLSRGDVLRHLGGAPDVVSAELSAFTEAAKILSSDHPRLINTHPMEWVGVYDGSIAASDADFDGLMTKLHDAEVPPSQTIVRFIDKTEKTFLL